jgi:hypothetical protein
MTTIELIYDPDCPNTEPARGVLREACAQAGIVAGWQEWDRSDAASPAHAQQYGSPTILVDGVDVAGSDTESDAKACRVYRTADGRLAGVPDVADVVRLVARSQETESGADV